MNGQMKEYEQHWEDIMEIINRETDKPEKRILSETPIGLNSETMLGLNSKKIKMMSKHQDTAVCQIRGLNHYPREILKRAEDQNAMLSLVPTMSPTVESKFIQKADGYLDFDFFKPKLVKLGKACKKHPRRIENLIGYEIDLIHPLRESSDSDSYFLCDEGEVKKLPQLDVTVKRLLGPLFGVEVSWNWVELYPEECIQKIEYYILEWRGLCQHKVLTPWRPLGKVRAKDLPMACVVDARHLNCCRSRTLFTVQICATEKFGYNANYSLPFSFYMTFPY